MRNPKPGNIPYIKTIFHHEQVTEHNRPVYKVEQVVKVQISFLRDSFRHVDLPNIDLTNYPFAVNDLMMMVNPHIYVPEVNSIELCTMMIYLEGIEFDTDMNCLISQIETADIWYCMHKNCGKEIKNK